MMDIEKVNRVESIIEKLSYYRFERDDLSIDECVSFLAKEWTKVHGRTTRQLVLQLCAVQCELETLRAEREQWMKQGRELEICKTHLDVYRKVCGDPAHPLPAQRESKISITTESFAGTIVPRTVEEVKLRAKEFADRFKAAMPAQQVAVPEPIVEALRQAIMVVAHRHGDVDTEDGSYATTDTDSIIRLESALCEALGTKYDDLGDLGEAIALLDALSAAPKPE